MTDFIHNLFDEQNGSPIIIYSEHTILHTQGRF